MTPSNSTYASVGIGIPVAVVVVWVLGLFNIVMPPHVEAALGALVSAGIGYFFAGGQRLAPPPVEGSDNENGV